MKKYRVGIIGTGFGGRVHAPLFQSHEGFDVVAIVSMRGNIETAKNLSGINNVYTDWNAMLDSEDLDLVVVASAVSLHKEMVRAIFAKGVHVLCEKPMALNEPETTDMIAARDDAKKWGLINHEFRFLPARSKVKEIMERGELGNITHVRYEFTHPIYKALTSKRRGWLGREEEGGGLLNALGSHAIDSLHWWMNSTLDSLKANLMTHIPTFTDEDGEVEHRSADDGYQIIGKLENGTTVTLDLVTAARKTTHTARLEMYGDKGTLVMCNDNQLLLSKGEETFEPVELRPDLFAPKDVTKDATPYYNAFKPMLDALHETLETGHKHPHLADFENGQATQKVIDKIRTSAKSE